MFEIVKYHNDLTNQIIIKTLNANELNFFYGICSKMRDKGINEVVFTFEQLKELVNWRSNDNIDFVRSLINTNKKLIRLNFTFKENKKTVQFVLFPTFITDEENKTLTVKVNEEFSFLLNTLTKNFTRFELEKFTHLTSKYSKYLYKELMKFKSTGYMIMSIEDFRNKLDIPNSYRMYDIDRGVLKICEEELSKIFKKFQYKKIKKGRKIASIEFLFSLKEENKKEVIEIEEENKVISPGSAFAEFWKNNFIGVNYTSKHQEVMKNLLKKYSESFLKNYLLDQWKYVQKNDSINNKAAYFSRLILDGKSAPKDYESLNRPISKKEDKEQAETFINTFFQDLNQVEENNYTEDDFEQANLFEEKTVKKEKEIREVTSEEYEEEYQKHLIELNIKDSEFQRKIFAKHSGLKIKAKKIYTEEDIPEEKLLSKNGRKLVGSALKMRVDKILKEMNQD